jgi:hypothetical protein
MVMPKAYPPPGPAQNIILAVTPESSCGTTPCGDGEVKVRNNVQSPEKENETRMSMPTPRRLMSALLAVACVGVVAACGDDDSSSDDSAKLTAGCKANFEVNDGFNKLFETTPELQGDKPPTKAQLPKIQANYDKLVAGPIEDLKANAPEEIQDDVNSAAAAAEKFRSTGNSEVLNSPAVDKNVAAMDGYYFENCPGQKATVEGVDYGYKGGPASYKPGAVRIKFPNTGKEYHELALVKKNPGTTESFDQLLKLPEDQVESKVTFVNGTDAEPGATGFLTGSLTKGDYLMVCFIPKGTTSEDKPGKGPPHFVLGMKKEFTVS